MRIRTSFFCIVIGLFSAISHAEQVDWKGLRTDSYLTVGYQLLAAAGIYYMPQDISGWDDKDRNVDYRISQYKHNIQHLRWDNDKCLVNCVGHPYFGAAYYMVARNRGLTIKGSFAYAFTMSAVFEYGIEAFFERPSIQDLIVTPLGGIVIGEFFYDYNLALKRRIADRGDAHWWENTLLFVTDPIGVLNRQVYRSFGVKSQLSLAPYVMKDSGAGLNILLEW